MKRVVFSGPPHSGKSTLIQGVSEIFPAAHVMPEPASTVISSHATTNGFWTEVASSPCTFSELCVNAAERAESSVPFAAKLIIMDRSVIDAIAYMRRDGCRTAMEKALELARSVTYNQALLCEAVGDYSNRPETAAEAALITDYVQQAYTDLGVQITKVPAMPMDERTSFVAELIRNI